MAGPFRVTFFRVSHSVPDSAAVLIEAGGARVVHSGDFKLDDDPPDGETTDREGIAAAVGAGVDLALVDSTNAERPGHSLSERAAGRRSARGHAGARGRVILTTFSSHVARLSQGIEAGLSAGRRVAMLGRSMRAVAEIAERFGRLRLPVGSRLGAADLRRTPPGAPPLPDLGKPGRARAPPSIAWRSASTRTWSSRRATSSCSRRARSRATSAR